MTALRLTVTYTSSWALATSRTGTLLRRPRVKLLRDYWLIPGAKICSESHPLFSCVLTSPLCWFSRYLCNFGSLHTAPKASLPDAPEVRDQSGLALQGHHDLHIWLFTFGLGLRIKAVVDIRIQGPLTSVDQQELGGCLSYLSSECEHPGDRELGEPYSSRIAWSKSKGHFRNPRGLLEWSIYKHGIKVQYDIASHNIKSKLHVQSNGSQSTLVLSGRPFGLALSFLLCWVQLLMTVVRIRFVVLKL